VRQEAQGRTVSHRLVKQICVRAAVPDEMEHGSAGSSGFSPYRNSPANMISVSRMRGKLLTWDHHRISGCIAGPTPAQLSSGNLRQVQ
jgi:hypothetical protein